jgi:hypothetical protein
MDALSPYVEGLEAMLLNPSLIISEGAKSAVNAALDGEMDAVLRKHVSLAFRRSGGIFFTPDPLADDLVSRLGVNPLPRVAFDPGCGSGNLLLALAKKLPVTTSAIETLSHWGDRLMGMDVHEVLVRAARARLALLACVRTGQTLTSTELSHLPDLLPNLVVGDSLSAEWPSANAYIMNPPFNAVVLERRQVPWASGSVSAAALFIDRALDLADANNQLVALLPDVLRSGTRYEKWRRLVTQRTQDLTVSVKGLFGNTADVDVFVLESIVVPASTSKSAAANWHEPAGAVEAARSRVGDEFSVRVGAVVPYRDETEGPLRPFLDVHLAKPWTTMTAVPQQRAFSGTVFEPPFVAIRRTSRPGALHRAVATVVVGENPVAVENHLIVALPKTGGDEACHRLMDVLREESTTVWLNDRIRCRHLTTRAVADLPWPTTSEIAK